MSRASVRHDAVWILCNLRLSGHQHEGGRILRLVDDVNDMCCLFSGMSLVSEWRGSMRRAPMSTQMSFRYCLESDGRSPKSEAAPHCCFVFHRLMWSVGIFKDIVPTRKI